MSLISVFVLSKTKYTSSSFSNVLYSNELPDINVNNLISLYEETYKV